MSTANASPRSATDRGPNYGIDSPGMVIGESVTGAIALACAIFFPRFFGHNLRWLEIVIAAEFLALASSMLMYSTYGKMTIRDVLLDSIPWRGSERVLDVGCGRGLLLIGAAKRLPLGSAVGVDKWVGGALTGNGAEAVLRNAEREDVVARVEVREGDARRLPFADSSFDAVISNFVVHEVDTAEEREQMISEMMRVLRPGGHLALVDFIFTGQCVEILQRLGMGDARRTRIGGLSIIPATILMLGAFRVRLVTASKERTS